jgi:hypothetical protein
MRRLPGSGDSPGGEAVKPDDLQAALGMILTRLGAIETALDALREAVEHGQAPTPAGDHAAHVALLQALFARAGGEGVVFSARDLVEDSLREGKETLRAALQRAAGRLTAKTVGRLLRRIEGVNLAGLTVTRAGNDRSGVQWSVASLQVRNLHHHQHHCAEPGAGA